MFLLMQTSCEIWSYALCMKVVFVITSGFAPPFAIPEAIATDCSSAMPTSTNCAPRAFLSSGESPMLPGMFGVIATNFLSFFALFRIYSRAIPV